MLFVFLTAPLAVGYMEHKVLAHMQARLGPMEAGRFHGWAQLIADGVKFIQKEDVIPKAADRWAFSLAPAVVLVPTIMIFIVLPFGPDFFAVNFDLGLFFVLAMSSVSRDRDPDGRLVQRQQVLADRGAAGGGPAHRVRAAR